MREPAVPERIVEVVWEDSSCTHSWHNESQHPGTSPCRSVGYVIKDDEMGILLAESLDDTPPTPNTDTARYGCEMMIPRSAIREVRELRRGRRN